MIINISIFKERVVKRLENYLEYIKTKIYLLKLSLEIFLIL
jgi:hypothetical protein